MTPAAGVLEGGRCPKLALSKMLGFRRYVGPLPAASPAVCSQGWLPGDTAVAAKADLQRFCDHLLAPLQQVAPTPSCLEANHVT